MRRRAVTERILLQVENLSKRFGGVEAVADVELSRASAARSIRCIGPNGAGKTTHLQHDQQRRAPERRHGASSRAATSPAPRRTASRRSGIGRTFQNLAVFKHATVVAEPADRPPLPHAHQRLRRRLVLRPRPARGDRAAAQGRGDHRLPRDRGHPRHARGRPVLRPAEARRTRPRAGHRAQAAAARRDGLRHEHGGDRGHRALRARHPRRTRHHRADDRARHGHRDGHLRPHLRAELRPQDRRRHPGRDLGATRP